METERLHNIIIKLVHKKNKNRAAIKITLAGMTLN